MHYLNIGLIVSSVIIIPTIASAQSRDNNVTDRFEYQKSLMQKTLPDTVDKPRPGYLLQQVTITAKRNSRQDSLNRRKSFLKEFNYKTPTLYNAFSSHKPSGNSGDLISVNPLALIALFTKSKNRHIKLQQKLVDDEQAEFVDRKFSKTWIGNITGLQGDSLLAFVTIYRPDYKFCQTASAYDILSYTKQKLHIFRSDKNAIAEFSINPFK